MKKGILILCLFLICLSCRKIETYKSPKLKNTVYQEVTFNQLLDSPAFYNNKKIKITGIFSYGEGEYLIDKYDRENRIWIEFNKENNLLDENMNSFYDNNNMLKFGNTTITLIGTYKDGNPGYPMLFIGALENIIFFEN